MPEVIVCHNVVSEKIRAAYQTACTFSMSRSQLIDLVNIDVFVPIRKAFSTQDTKSRLEWFASGQLDAFIHVISTEHCEVVCKGADGAIHKGANSAGTGLRWKGTDFLFTAIEVQP